MASFDRLFNDRPRQPSLTDAQNRVIRPDEVVDPHSWTSAARANLSPLHAPTPEAPTGIEPV
jgi:hypothetical protein